MLSTMRTAALATGMIVAAGTAYAADIYSPPPETVVAVVPTIDWTGFYIGANAGYGWGSGDGSTNYTPSAAAFGANPFSSSTDLDGFIGGGQIGYNWQSGAFVGGIEADLMYSDMNGTHTKSPLQFFGGGNIANSYQRGSGSLDWLATVRGRAGYLATPELLLYATGGLAFGDVNYHTTTQFGASPALRFGASGSDTLTGWTVGAGTEWKFAPNWSAKLEYMYFDLGDVDYRTLANAPVAPFRVTQEFDTSGSIVRAGVNYQFSMF